MEVLEVGDPASLLATAIVIWGHYVARLHSYIIPVAC